jgi:hypothetical protein
VTERRDPERSRARGPVRQPPLAGDPAPAQDTVRDLQRQAGNKAVADLLSHKSVQAESASAAIRLRDSLRAGRSSVQREFGLAVQRIDKSDLKQPGRLLKSGTQGNDVAMLQQLLGINADGIFGGQTRARVIEFQQASGLAADGMVGPMTWSALVSATASTGKLPETIDKLPPETIDKLPPETTDKIPSESTEKIPSESTDKQFESTDKQFESTDKLA